MQDLKKPIACPTSFHVCGTSLNSKAKILPKFIPVDNEFGNNAALGCHLANHSYFNKTIAVWDGAGRKIKG